jgi:hypothetical protein
MRSSWEDEQRGEAESGDKPSTMRQSIALSLRRKHLPAHNLVFFQGSYSLSFEEEMGRLIWRGASCLDAFSSSPFPT